VPDIRQAGVIIIRVMGEPSLYTVQRVRWTHASAQLRAVRTAVFIREQGIAEALEWDEMDPVCLHALALSSAAEAIGTGRLLRDGHIGRMAVVAQWRGLGVGGALLRELIAAAVERGDAVTELSAQTHAIGFYRRHGFEETGAEYLEAGIPHRRMRLALRPR
jgi:predicted GNAT family N-acyltransferase